MPVLRKTINLAVSGNVLVATDSITGLATTDAGVQGENGAILLHVAVPSDWQSLTVRLRVIALDGSYDESDLPVSNAIDMSLRQGVLVPGRITVSLIGSDADGNIRKTADCRSLLVTASALPSNAIAKEFPIDFENLKSEVSTNESTMNTHISSKDNPHDVTASQVGLGSANNTSDADKPISTAQQAALDLKADKANAVIAITGSGGALITRNGGTVNVDVTGAGGDMQRANYANGSGIANANKVDHAMAADNATNAVTAATQSSSDSSTKIATTAFVHALDDLKAPLNSPAFTGTPTSTTPAAGDNSTKIANTAFVHALCSLLAPLNSPALTGAPTAPTPAAGDNSAKIATTAFVQGKLSDIIALAGWTLSTATFAYTSADSPIFVMTSSVNVTANFYPGVRVKLTQDSAIKYFIVHAASGTSITLYGGTDYTLTSSPITAVSFSAQKCPIGFPLNPAKWTVQLVDTNDHQGYANVVGTWYNALSIIVPIGIWRLSYSCIASPYRSPAGTLSQTTTLSTTNNGETDNIFTARLSAGSLTDINAPVKAENVVGVSAKTTYYLNVKTLDSGTNLRILSSTFGQPTILSAVDAYL